MGLSYIFYRIPKKRLDYFVHGLTINMVTNIVMANSQVRFLFLSV